LKEQGDLVKISRIEESKAVSQMLLLQDRTSFEIDEMR
jgi:hypothetical protein